MSSKPVDTVKLLLALVGLVKSAAVAISVVIVEWAMAKKSHAEKKEIVAGYDLEAEKKKNLLKEKNDVKDPVSYLDSVLNDDSSINGS